MRTCHRPGGTSRELPLPTVATYMKSNTGWNGLLRVTALIRSFALALEGTRSSTSSPTRAVSALSRAVAHSQERVQYRLATRRQYPLYDLPRCAVSIGITALCQASGMNRRVFQGRGMTTALSVAHELGFRCSLCFHRKHLSSMALCCPRRRAQPCTHSRRQDAWGKLCRQWTTAHSPCNCAPTLTAAFAC